ncbi:MAG TPA: DUF4395 family protein [Actinomycetota bacterium]|nr:DUF4395 family protein [Actinomycetota bacterium]
MNSVKAPTAHPYDDTEVVDVRAPRFVQGTTAVLSIVALITGWWGLPAAMGLQLIVGLTFGRRYCLPCVAYFELVQPRLGEGEIEDARAPRFANILGAIFLTAATAAHAFGASTSAWADEASTFGWMIIAMVAALATLASVTGLCVGCEMYRFAAKVKGVRPGHFDSVDLSELGVERREQVVIHFTHPLCSGCKTTSADLTARGHELVEVDVSRRPDLARKYHVSIVPTAFSVAPTGRVLERLA